MISEFAEALVVLVLGGIIVVLYVTSRELARKPVSADAVLVDLALGLIAVWIFALVVGLMSGALS